MDLQAINNFLKKLSANNTREWMADNKTEYQDTRKIFEELVGKLIDGVSLFDGDIVGQPAKKSLFRLNRDTRFSKEKSPYKLNYGGSFSKEGRKSPFASYYVHLMPGNNFVGGGMYMPEAEYLKKIRQEIDYNPEELLRIIQNKDFEEVFGQMQGDKLKTSPKGYSKDHQYIDLLRHKGFYFLHQIDDQELKDVNIVEKMIGYYKQIHPFVQYMNTAID